MLIVNRYCHYDKQPIACDAQLAGTQGGREDVRGELSAECSEGCMARKCRLGMSGE